MPKRPAAFAGLMPARARPATPGLLSQFEFDDSGPGPSGRGSISARRPGRTRKTMTAWAEATGITEEEDEYAGHLDYRVAGGRVWLGNATVRPDDRRTGVATALLDELHRRTGLPLVHGDFMSPGGIQLAFEGAARYPDRQLVWLGGDRPFHEFGDPRGGPGEPEFWDPASGVPDWRSPTFRLHPSRRQRGYSYRMTKAEIVGAVEAGIAAAGELPGRARPEGDYAGSHGAPDFEPGSSMDNPENIFPPDIYSADGWRLYGAGGDEEGWARDRETVRIIQSVRGKPDARITVYRAIPDDIGRDAQLERYRKERAAYLRRGEWPAGTDTKGMADDEYYGWLVGDPLDEYRPEGAAPTGEIARLEALPPEPPPTINPGDWVTPNREYAKQHGESNLGFWDRGGDAYHPRYKIVSRKVRAAELHTDGDIHEWGWNPPGELPSRATPGIPASPDLEAEDYFLGDPFPRPTGAPTPGGSGLPAGMDMAVGPQVIGEVFSPDHYRVTARWRGDELGRMTVFFGRVTGLVVREDVRRRGIATALLERASEVGPVEHDEPEQRTPMGDAFARGRPVPGYVDPNTVAIDTALGPVTFLSRGDAVGPEYHAIYHAQLGDGTVVGRAHVSHLGDEAAVQHIEVEPQYRRKGVARALLARVQAENPEATVTTLGDVVTPEGAFLGVPGRRRPGDAPTLPPGSGGRNPWDKGPREPEPAGEPEERLSWAARVSAWLRGEREEPTLEGWEKKAHQAPPPDVWDDHGTVKLMGAAGGSNGARFAEAKDGTRWLVKAYRGHRDKVATELLANAVYRRMGVKVPEAGTLQFGGKPALAYPLLDGEVRRWEGEDPTLAEGFMVDALVANWDVVGLEMDNVLWSPEGEPFRRRPGRHVRVQGAGVAEAVRAGAVGGVDDGGAARAGVRDDGPDPGVEAGRGGPDRGVAGRRHGGRARGRGPVRGRADAGAGAGDAEGEGRLDGPVRGRRGVGARAGQGRGGEVGARGLAEGAGAVPGAGDRGGGVRARLLGDGELAAAEGAAREGAPGGAVRGARARQAARPPADALGHARVLRGAGGLGGDAGPGGAREGLPERGPGRGLGAGVRRRGRRGRRARGAGRGGGAAAVRPGAGAAGEAAAAGGRARAGAEVPGRRGDGGAGRAGAAGGGVLRGLDGPFVGGANAVRSGLTRRTPGPTIPAGSPAPET